jgi:23S rRNA (cytosine1962-C5)-methyltransferase
MNLIHTIKNSLEIRKKNIPPDKKLMRLFEGKAYGYGDLHSVKHENSEIPNGLVIDIYDDALRILTSKNHFPIDEIIETIKEYYSVNHIFLHEKSNHLKGNIMIQGDNYKEQIIEEYGVKYFIDIARGQNSGLFLDAASVRKYILNGWAKDKRVLNLYSYTCSLGVCAEKSQAFSTTNVDNSKGVLLRGMKNYELNGFTPDNRGFSKGDVRDKLKRWIKKGAEFDRIILDPPPVFTRNKYSIKNLPQQAKMCLKLLSEQGELIILSQYSEISFEEFVAHLDLNPELYKTERILPEIDVWPSQTGDSRYKFLMVKKFVNC